MATELIRRLLDESSTLELNVTSAPDLAAAAPEHSAELEGALLFVALVAHPTFEATGTAAVVVAEHADVLALMEIASWLGRGGQVHAAIRSTLGKAFLRRATNRSDDYGSRSQALKAAMIIAQSERSLLRRLQADLLDLEPSDDGLFLRHAARVAGAIIAHEPADDLRRWLHTLLDVADAEDEVSFELGLDTMRTALDATSPDDALVSFNRARDLFARSERSAEDRIDARLYRSCLDVLVEFQSGRVDGDLTPHIDAIRRTAFDYGAMLTVSDREPETASWLSAKDRERIHWSSLALRLGAVSDKIDRAAWLKVAEVMEDELLSIYSASRSILRRNADGGLEEVVRPRIVGAMQKEMRSLAILEQWIEENETSTSIVEAASLRDLVRQARGDLVSHRPSEAAAGSSPTAAIIEQIPAAQRQTVTARIQANALDMLDETVSRIVDGELAKVVAGLERNVDFREREDARCFFEVLLLHATRFVVSRYNLSTATFPGATYLFNRDTSNSPLEADLQHDFIDHLGSSTLSEICSFEARDLGGGRVDVLFTFKWMKTVSELKRSSAKRSSDELVDLHGPQAVAYQGTNVSFAMLMVLDLFDRKGAQPNIRDQIGVHHRMIADSSVENAVVLFRLQGMRHTPSDIPRTAVTSLPASVPGQRGGTVSVNGN